MTGLKHYLGPFEAYAQGVMADTPFHEDEPRTSAPNFYYAQEDELFAAAGGPGSTGACTARTPSSASPSATP